MVKNACHCLTLSVYTRIIIKVRRYTLKMLMGISVISWMVCSASRRCGRQFVAALVLVIGMIMMIDIKITMILSVCLRPSDDDNA